MTGGRGAATDDTDHARHDAACQHLAELIATATPAAWPALVAVYDVHAAGCGREAFSLDLA